MDLLKRQTRAHKYRDYLSEPEIEGVLAKYLPKLKLNEIYNLKLPEYQIMYPEIYDMYAESYSSIIKTAKDELKKEFMKKIQHNIVTPEQALGIKQYLATL